MLAVETRLGARQDQVAAKVMDGDAILINLSNGLYYRIGGVGGWVWSLVESRHSIAEISDIVSKHFELAAEDILPDIQRLVSELMNEELICVVEETMPASNGGGSGALTSYAPPVLEKFSDMQDMFALDPPLPGLADVPGQDPPQRFDN